MAEDGDEDGELLSSFLFRNKVSQVVNVSSLAEDGDGDGDRDVGGDEDGELLSSFLYWFFSSTLRLCGSSLEFIFNRFVESKYEEVSLRKLL